jgi:hypothetical protein
MWQPIVKTAHFLVEAALGILVILGFMCWVWFIAGLLYYRNNKDLPDYHVEAEEHEGMTWWNAWRWSVSDTYRPLSDNVIVESSVFGLASGLALIWVLDLVFK